MVIRAHSPFLGECRSPSLLGPLAHTLRPFSCQDTAVGAGCTMEMSQVQPSPIPRSSSCSSPELLRCSLASSTARLRRTCSYRPCVPQVLLYATANSGSGYANAHTLPLHGRSRFPPALGFRPMPSHFPQSSPPQHHRSPMSRSPCRPWRAGCSRLGHSVLCTWRHTRTPGMLPT